jgi:hypothetical protein
MMRPILHATGKLNACIAMNEYTWWRERNGTDEAEREKARK